MKIGMPEDSEYAPNYNAYVEKARYQDLVSALKQEGEKAVQFFLRIPEDKAEHRYAEGKWSIKELIVHLSDAERIFAYRALRFARNDKTDLPGFDENTYAPESNAGARSLNQVIKEYQSVRGATLTLFSSLTEEMAMRQGTANGKAVSVRALGAIIIGHTAHHLQIIQERYL